MDVAFAKTDGAADEIDRAIEAVTVAVARAGRTDRPSISTSLSGTA